MKLLPQIKKIYESNHKVGEFHGIHYDYTCPSPTFYPFQWLWDSCFNSIALSHFDVDRAKREANTLLLNQRGDGFIPCVSFWGPVNPLIKPFYITQVTQPPVIPISVETIYRKSKDKSFLKKLYPKMKLFMDWLASERDSNKNGLVEIVHPWETGIDATPSFDSQLGIKEVRPSFFKVISLYVGLSFRYSLLGWDNKKMLKKHIFVNEELLFNCIYVKSLKTMANFARELGISKDEIVFESRYAQAKSSLIKNHWSGKDKIFYNLDGNSHQVKIKTISSLMPLIIDDLPLRYAKPLIEEHLLNKKEFWSDFPIPSVAMTEKTFYPGGGFVLWRGGTWMSTNWFLSKALAHWGYKTEVGLLNNKTTHMIEKNGYWEYYNPLTGKGYGQKNLTWSGLILDMMEYDKN